MAEERDDEVSRRYRELEAAEPRPEVDRAILAAAREATGRARAPLVAPGGRQRWYYSLAAAAVAVFAVAITVHMEREQPDVEAPMAPAPEPPAQVYEKKQPAPEAAPAAPAPQPSRDALQKRSAAASQPRRQTQAAPGFVPEPPPQLPGRADAEMPRPESAAADVASAKPEQRSRQILRSAPPSGASANAAREMAKIESPDKWLERIAELRSRGRHAEADKALAEFRRAYPGYRIPEAMRERVEGTTSSQ